ncbi:hypothetical protein VCSRO186_0348 [Vibrio cholerae]|nr:hypothetical protein VCSRO197_3443 [Vibrio cholerae]GHZ23918.1 hypothetical protein VCSRO79_0205 [Vibrio cholerae]GIB27445.1 hypothetical protein VCSRO186_0348 [Vibrio cholerae]
MMHGFMLIGFHYLIFHKVVKASGFACLQVTLLDVDTAIFNL